MAATNELDPLVAMSFGRRGDGKSLWMTCTLLAQLQRFYKYGCRPSPRYPNGFKIATNYHVLFSDFSNPMLVDMISGYDERLKRVTAGIDEVGSYVPSRRSSARVNVDWGNALVQIRKIDMELVSTTQYPQNIDSQMLQQIDLFVMPLLYNYRWVPERELWSHKATGRMVYKPTSLHFLVWDWWGNHTGKQWQKRWPPQLSGEPPDDTKDYHNVHEVFSWFSTKERIPSMWHRNRQNIILQEWEHELTDMAEEYAPEVMEEQAEEREYRKPATIKDLVNAQPDDVFLYTLLDEARKIDPNIKSAYQLASKFEQEGWTVIKEGRFGYRALRLST